MQMSNGQNIRPPPIDLRVNVYFRRYDDIGFDGLTLKVRFHDIVRCQTAPAAAPVVDVEGVGFRNPIADMPAEIDKA